MIYVYIGLNALPSKTGTDFLALHMAPRNILTDLKVLFHHLKPRYMQASFSENKQDRWYFNLNSFNEVN